MNINKEQFLALSLSMSLGLSVSCQKKDPNSASDNAQTSTAQDPVEEGYSPEEEVYEEVNPYGSCDEVATASGVQYFSYDSTNECFVECTDENTQCYDIWDECTEWDNTDECINYEKEVASKDFPNGCARLFKENDSFVDPTFECYEWK